MEDKMISTKTVQNVIDSNLINISVLNNKSILDHAHKDIELIYIIKGDLQVKVNKKTFMLSKSDFFIINSNELHSLQSKEDNLFALFHFNYFQLCSLIGNENIYFTFDSMEHGSYSNPQLQYVIEELLSVYLKQSNYSKVVFLEKTLKLISIIQLDYLKSTKQVEIYNYPTAPENSHNERLDEILKYIHENFRDPLSLQEVADMQYITVPYLSKYFKKQTGKTFSEYLNKVRLANAVNELINTNKPITRIALDNGFPNLAAFNRVFNERYQMKPIDYRKENAEPIVNNEIVLKKKRKLEENEALSKLSNYLDSTLSVNPNIRQTSAEIETQIVTMDKLVAYSKYWKKVINIGYATDLLNSDMQEHITLLQNEIGFTYARFWGLFSDEMHVEDYSSSGIVYNFSNVNKLLDFLIKNRLKPFIELGPKPKIVSKTFNHTLILEKSSEKSLEEWQNLLRAFLLHCIERYGIDEVETWYFEVWSNDIDPINTDVKSEGGDVNNNNRHDLDLFEKYLKVFNIIKRSMNEIVPLAKVGGCGLTMDLESNKLDLFIKKWKQNEVQPDFLSIYLYPIEIESDKKRDLKKNLLSTNPNYLKSKIKQVNRSLRKSGFDDLELNVTEWNISISNRDYLNDSCFKAAYIVKNIIDNLNQNLNMMGYWMCSDIFSDYRDSKSLLHGGAGLITKNGIKKPSYHSFILLKHLGEILISKGDNYIVTKKTGDRYQIIFFNYKHFDYSYYLNPEGSADISEQYDIFENNDALNISLELQGISNGKYRIKEHRLNRDQGSILDEWLKFGSVYDIKPDEVEYLKQKSVPYMKVDHNVVEKNSIIITGELQPHEVRLYELNLLLRD